MRRILILLCCLPFVCFSQHRATRVVQNPNVADCAGYCFRGHLPAAGETYCAEATALFARMTTQPTTERKEIINTFIVSLKTAGVWSKLDAMYVLAAADQQAALLNWIADTNNATTVNSPTFTVDEGIQGNGTSSYVDTHYEPYSDSVHFSRTSGHYSVYSRSNISDGNYVDFGLSRYVTVYSHSYIVMKGSATSAVACLVMGSATTAHNITSSLGLYVVNVIGGNLQFYQNSTQKLNTAHTPLFMPTGNMYLGCRNYYVSSPTPSGYSSRQFAFVSIGGGLTSTEQANLYNAVEAYMDALGTGVIP